MFDALTSLSTSKSMYNMLENDGHLRIQALRLFEQRLNSGHGLMSRLKQLGNQSKHNQALLSLADSGGNHSQQHYIGVKTVRLDRIVGTENRTSEFDRDFLPRAEHLERRWVSVAMAYLKDVVLPPVDLIQVGEVYYVRDGHHRISVARAFGQESINAVVTVWE